MSEEHCYARGGMFDSQCSKPPGHYGPWHYDEGTTESWTDASLPLPPAGEEVAEDNDETSDRAWLCPCGRLNRGDWYPEKFCPGCRFESPHIPVERFWLITDTGKADG